MKQIQELHSLDTNKPDDLLVVSASFEPRCLGVNKLVAPYRANAVIILNPVSNVTGKGARKQMDHMDKLFPSMCKIDSSKIASIKYITAHDQKELLLAIQEYIEVRKIAPLKTITIDISCLTKIQLFFLIRWTWQNLKGVNVRLIYTKPMRYNTVRSVKTELSWEYSQPFVTSLTRSGKRPINKKLWVILGHEGDRILNTWRYAEPDETILVRARSDEKHLNEQTSNRNAYLLSRCKINPMVKVREFDPLNVGWALSELYRTNPPSAMEAAQNIIATYGPKPLIVSMAVWSCLYSKIWMDFLYSVPGRYDENYSEGIKASFLFEFISGDKMSFAENA